MSFDLGQFILIQVRSEKNPCIVCGKTVETPIFIQKLPPHFEEKEFIPRPICTACSDVITYGDDNINIDNAYNATLNKHASPYICDKNDHELIETHKKIKRLIKQKSVFNKQHPFLYIYGTSGSGKTIIAKTISEILRFRFIKSYDLQNLHKTDSSIYHNKLCIDDLGKEIEGQNFAYLTYRLIDSRYDNKLPTIITTQLTPDDLENIYGQDFADRIKHYSVVVQMPNQQNWRKQH